MDAAKPIAGALASPGEVRPLHVTLTTELFHEVRARADELRLLQMALRDRQRLRQELAEVEVEVAARLEQLRARDS